MIQSIIQSHISSLYRETGFTAVLSAPPKPEHGEYCFGVFTLAKPTGKNPAIIAEEVANILRSDTEYFKSVNTIGGYVNITFTTRVWADILTSIIHPTLSKPGSGKTIVVDYIGANIGKVLHIGHLCTPSIGQAFCNIYKYLGYNVIGDVHTGDWGGIFGKLIFHEKLGMIVKRGKNGNSINNDDAIFRSESDKNDYIEIWDYMENTKVPKPEGEVWEAFKRFSENNYTTYGYLRWLNDGYMITTHYCDVYKKVDEKYREEYRSLSEGNPVNIGLWKEMTVKSLISVQTVMDLMHVNPTVAIGESFYEGLNLPKIGEYPVLQFTMKDIVSELTKSNIAKKNEEDGSVGIIFESWENNSSIFDEKTWEKIKKLPSNMLQKRDGTHGYFASDLACIRYRVTNGWNPTKIIYCTDIRQELHFKQVFAVARMAGWINQDVELIHAPNGFIKLPDGAMSSRTGKIIALKELIDEGFLRTKNILEEKGRTGENVLSEGDIREIAIGAIKYSYLMQDRERDITFDWDKALSFEGNSGPYIQYACVRAQKVAQSTQIDSFDISGSILSEYDTALIRTLAMMDEKIMDSANKYKPHTLALYCYDLSVCFNSFYVHTPKILEESDINLKNLRLTLCRLVSEKLTLGFDLLAIKMPSEM